MMETHRDLSMCLTISQVKLVEYLICTCATAQLNFPPPSSLPMSQKSIYLLCVCICNFLSSPLQNSVVLESFFVCLFSFFFLMSEAKARWAVLSWSSRGYSRLFAAMTC